MFGQITLFIGEINGTRKCSDHFPLPSRHSPFEGVHVLIDLVSTNSGFIIKKNLNSRGVCVGRHNVILFISSCVLLA